MMRLSIFGLGYVGVVCAACFSRLGHSVIGVDPNRVKLDLLAAGRSPIVETGLQELIAEAVQNGRLAVTTDAAHAVEESDLSLICVGTPSSVTGELDLTAIRTVCTEIGAALRGKIGRHGIIVRSTMLAGTMHRTVIPTIKAAMGVAGSAAFDIAINPEFLREGSAIADFENPTRTVIGSDDPDFAKRAMTLYDGLPGEKLITGIATAEIVKYFDNAWHALKVAFANEIGTICKSVGVDSREAMSIFLRDSKLNISTAYLRPGFAFGGSCLPKDVRALDQFATAQHLDLPLIRNVLKSNTAQIERGVAWVLRQGKRKISFLGFSFKAGTDDLRESPYLEMIERLIGKGCDIRIYDESVEISRLLGANREFLLERIPHVAQLLVPSAKEAIDHGDVIIVTQEGPQYEGAARLVRPGQQVLDFSGIPAFSALGMAYDGISW